MTMSIEIDLFESAGYLLVNGFEHRFARRIAIVCLDKRLTINPTVGIELHWFDCSDLVC